MSEPISTPIATTSTAKAWAPDIVTFPAADVVPDLLLLQCSTVAGAIQGDEPALRVPFIDDDSATFVAEGAEIDEAEPTLSEITVHTAKLAQLVRVSREQYLQSGTAGMLSDSMRRAVTNAANTAFLGQAAPTPPAVAPPAGLTNITGVTAGGDVDGDLDALVDAIAGISAAGGNPSHVLLSPAGWANMRKLKVGTGSAQSLLGAGTTDAAASLLGVPTLVTGALTGSSGLVIDKSAVVSAVGNIEVAVSQDAFFQSDSVGVRVTLRAGWNVVRPERLVAFDVVDPDAAG